MSNERFDYVFTIYDAGTSPLKLECALDYSEGADEAFGAARHHADLVAELKVLAAETNSAVRDWQSMSLVELEREFVRLGNCLWRQRKAGGVW